MRMFNAMQSIRWPIDTMENKLFKIVLDYFENVQKQDEVANDTLVDK